MSSETDFLNTALGRAGLPAITSLQAQEPNAQWCRTLYPPLRRAMIRSYQPNFAKKRKILQPDATGPVFGYAYAFNLPDKCLMVIEYAGDLPTVPTTDPKYYAITTTWKVEGRQLLSNDSIVAVRYVEDIDNPALWDPMWFQWLATLLAADLIDAVYKDPNRSKVKREEAIAYWMPSALATDGQEKSLQEFIVDDLTWGRQ